MQDHALELQQSLEEDAKLAKSNMFPRHDSDDVSMSDSLSISSDTIGGVQSSFSNVNSMQSSLLTSTTIEGKKKYVRVYALWTLF